METEETKEIIYSDKAKRQIKWMEKWCKKEGLTLALNGECGFGRPCVGVLGMGDTEDTETYPDYLWYKHDDDNNLVFDENDELVRLDPNGKVWTPEDAYHKHECVAVLWQSEESIAQLYKWLKWFEKNNFHYKRVPVEKEFFDPIELMMGRNYHHQMVRCEKEN